MRSGFSREISFLDISSTVVEGMLASDVILSYKAALPAPTPKRLPLAGNFPRPGGDLR